MLKRIVVVLVLIAAALVGYNYLTTGKFGLIPSTTMSEQEREIDSLIQQVRQAATGYAQAGRAAGMSGIDTTADAEVARQQIEAIQKKAKELQKKATEKTRAGLARLQLELDKAKRDIGMK